MLKKRLILCFFLLLAWTTTYMIFSALNVRVGVVHAYLRGFDSGRKIPSVRNHSVGDNTFFVTKQAFTIVDSREKIDSRMENLTPFDGVSRYGRPAWTQRPTLDYPKDSTKRTPSTNPTTKEPHTEMVPAWTQRSTLDNPKVSTNSTPSTDPTAEKPQTEMIAAWVQRSALDYPKDSTKRTGSTDRTTEQPHTEMIPAWKQSSALDYPKDSTKRTGLTDPTIEQRVVASTTSLTSHTNHSDGRVALFSDAKAKFPFRIRKFKFGTPFPEPDLPPLAQVTCRRNSTFRIPNIIHHIWFGVRTFQFYHYISMRSAALIQRPDEVRFYCDTEEPKGPFWSRYKADVPCLKIFKMQSPARVLGRNVSQVEHKSDVARLRILLDSGGIYLDDDTVVVRPFDSLMQYSCVLGEEVPGAYGNGIILSEPWSPFLDKWYRSYDTFNDSKWSEHSVIMPFRIHEEYPDLPLHVEEESFLKPNWSDGMQWFEQENYDISRNFCVHLYARYLRQSTLRMKERDILSFDATYGALARIALYGKADLIYLQRDERLQ